MQPSKMSRNSQILIQRNSQTKQIISLFSVVFEITQNAISQEPIAQSPWGFHQIKAQIIP